MQEVNSIPVFDGDSMARDAAPYIFLLLGILYQPHLGGSYCARTVTKTPSVVGVRSTRHLLVLAGKSEGSLSLTGCPSSFSDTLGEGQES